MFSAIWWRKEKQDMHKVTTKLLGHLMTTTLYQRIYSFLLSNQNICFCIICIFICFLFCFVLFYILFLFLFFSLKLDYNKCFTTLAASKHSSLSLYIWNPQWPYLMKCLTKQSGFHLKCCLCWNMCDYVWVLREGYPLIGRLWRKNLCPLL